MNNSTGYILGGIIVLLLVWIYYSQHRDWNTFCEGLWIAGDDFCVRSDIEGMMIYIGPNIETWCEKRKAFMIVYTNHTVVSCSLLLTINGLCSRKKISVEPDADADSQPSILPENLSAVVSMASGKMTWYHDDTIYAELYKDAASTFEATR
jgi:hypothetical protein